MADNTEFLNVYSGPSSLRDYFDPDIQPPLPLVEIPDSLNPYRSDGVRIYAKMMTMLPAHNVKALPALNLLSKSVIPDKTKTVIEYSSGSTVISMAMIARICHGIDDTRAFLSNKTSEAKLRLMQFFGLDITLFGGPSQPEPDDERGGIQTARRRAAQESTIVNPNQYENDANWQAHYRWTGPQILKQLPDIRVICAGMGTSGTMTGIGTFIKEHKPSVLRLGVCTAPGDRIPGPRSYALLSPVEFPWRSAIDAVEEVGSVPAYTLSMQLSREGLVCGPSSGFNLQGLYQFVAKRKASNTLDELRGESGDINCVFLCCDLPHQYIDEYFSKLSPASFPEIKNKHLTSVDKHRYDEAWERPFLTCVSDFYTSQNLKPNALVLDLRQPADFSAEHLPGALNLPLESLSTNTPSPFYNSMTLESQWLELERLFSDGKIRVASKGSSVDLGGMKVLLVCYDGDTARVATSVLRAKGVAADSVKGGAKALAELTAGLEVLRGTEEVKGWTEMSTVMVSTEEVRVEVVA